MDAKTFTAALARENEERLAALAPPEQHLAEGGTLTVRSMLKMALKNEIEATEIAALWVPSTPELDAKLGFARQVADESKHYRLIEERLRELGEDLSGFNPLGTGQLASTAPLKAGLPPERGGAGHSPLYAFLASLQGTVERAAAAQFTREAVALIKNGQFIEFCLAAGDRKTAALYTEIIQPDEKFHHQLGRKILEKYAVTPELQSQARAASARTLDLAEELQQLALAKMGIHHAPGC